MGVVQRGKNKTTATRAEEEHSNGLGTGLRCQGNEKLDRDAAIPPALPGCKIARTVDPTPNVTQRIDLVVNN